MDHSDIASVLVRKDTHFPQANQYLLLVYHLMKNITHLPIYLPSYILMAVFQVNMGQLVPFTFYV